MACLQIMSYRHVMLRATRRSAALEMIVTGACTPEPVPQTQPRSLWPSCGFSSWRCDFLGVGEYNERKSFGE